MPSATGGIARLVYSRLRERNIPATPLLAKAGLSVEQIDDRSARVKARSQIRFLELAADALQDDLLGFHLARDYDLREIGLLYYVLASSDVLHDALQKAARYSGIANEGVALKFRATGKPRLRWITSASNAGRTVTISSSGWCPWFACAASLPTAGLIPSRIRVVHHRKKMPAEFRSLLGCEVEFGSAVDEVVFPAAVASMAIGSADPHLNELLTKYCEEALAHRAPARGSLRSSVENAMAPLLPHGQANAVEIARRIGMSHRTLVRRLSAEGLTFSDIAEDLKGDLARRYLRDGDLPISQIAWLLGYREVSAFTHAFRRWTGMTPRQARAQLPPATADFAAKAPQARRTRGR